jgi:hypothetical protein
VKSSDSEALSSCLKERTLEEGEERRPGEGEEERRLGEGEAERRQAAGEAERRPGEEGERRLVAEGEERRPAAGEAGRRLAAAGEAVAGRTSVAVSCTSRRTGRGRDLRFEGTSAKQNGA